MKLPSGMRSIVNADVTYLDKLFFNQDGLLRPVPYAELKDIPHDHLSIFALNNALCQIITQELVDFIKGEIGSRSAIEIGSGSNCLYRGVGITGTDSYLQQTEEMKGYYSVLKHEVTKPATDEERMDALTAVENYKPQVVVGSFITQFGTEEQVQNGIPASPFGVDELELLLRVDKYIHIGNYNTHARKFIFAKHHKSKWYPWLINRASDQSKNRIWIWGK